MKLEWIRLPGDRGQLASGDSWTYLAARDDRTAVLTRWGSGLTRADVARQAALYAVQIGGAYDVVPEAVAAVLAHLRDAAQAFESRLDVTGQPAWHHGYIPPCDDSPSVTSAAEFAASGREERRAAVRGRFVLHQQPGQET
jgi:hypothetical protein